MFIILEEDGDLITYVLAQIVQKSINHVSYYYKLTLFLFSICLAIESLK